MTVPSRTGQCIIVDPRMLTASRWANETAYALRPFGTVPALADERQWRQWANAVCSLPAVAAVGAPRQEGFADWRSWAVQFNQSIVHL